MEIGEGAHMQKTEAFLGFFLILMGSIDCLTTVIGVLYHGATELNPFMTGIVNSNIGDFLVVKIAATVFTEIILLSLLDLELILKIFQGLKTFMLIL